MRYFPVNLDIRGRKALVVGGGTVGSRKAHTLLRAGAQVTLISPQASDAIRALAEAGRLTWHQRPYRSSDMSAVFLVFSATDDPDLNDRIAEDAAKHGALCNYADQPQRGHFILPSVVERGDLVISISTSGKSPAVARRLRQDLEACFGDEYAPYLRLLGAIRERLLAREHAPDQHRKVFARLIDGGLLALVRAGDRKGIDRLLESVLGESFDASLMDCK
ncbi:MAG: bifunctional precorrin-2 dehydrogenase/sirohydrochlorin ferrochelatase [Desulfobacterales bacterium]|jgi:precorrin-2 dehydrogenase/sirohydrochlorin ferrochelatase